MEENQYNPQAIIPQAVIGLDGAGDGNLKRRGAEGDAPVELRVLSDSAFLALSVLCSFCKFSLLWNTDVG